MKYLKIIFGSLAVLWGLGIFLKLLRNLPALFSNDLGVSRLLGAVAGMIIAGLISYKCFSGAFKQDSDIPGPPHNKTGP